MALLSASFGLAWAQRTLVPCRPEQLITDQGKWTLNSELEMREEKGGLAGHGVAEEHGPRPRKASLLTNLSVPQLLVEAQLGVAPSPSASSPPPPTWLKGRPWI